MTSAFAALDAMLSGAVDARLGETLRIEPQVKRDNVGNAIGVDTREPIDIVGTLIEGAPDIDFLAGDRRITEFNGRAANYEAWASFDRANIPAGYFLRKSDLIVASTPSTQTFEIIETANDGTSRIACLLVRK